MELKNLESSIYKSCIRVSGLSLLPPLITDERRTILRDFKRKAVELEKQGAIKTKSQARSYKTNNFNEEIVNNSKKAIHLGSLEQALAFSCNDDVSSCPKSNDNLETVISDKEKVPQLTSYVFDVSEYSDNGIVLFNDSLSTNEIDQQSGTKPKLIRSNSYILESPSPALLNEIKRQAQANLDVEETFEQENKRLESASAYSIIEDSAYETEDKPNSEVELNSLLENCSFEHTNLNDTIEMLLEKHFGFNNNEVIKSPQQIQISHDDTFTLEDHNPIPDLQDIFDILEKHRIGVETKISSSKTNICEFTEETPRSHEEFTEETPRLRDDSEISTTNVFSTSTPLLIDFESDSCDNEPLSDYQRNCTHNEIDSDPLHVLMSLDDYQRLSDPFEIYQTKNSCNRELFRGSSKKSQQKLKEIWAAGVLTAAAKGFLVRRLKRTDKVKALIQTIHDSVVCAMNLHKEDTDTIEEADVELHRRLILQVSSACYEFYDIFFNLTTKEQMALIAHDRQRQLDKLKRARSSMKIDSERSTPRSRQSLNIKQRKILTPSFAA